MRGAGAPLSITPNILAYAVLALSPVAVWVLYDRLDAGRALIWTVIGSYLLMPPLLAFDLPMVPDLDKDTLPPLAATVITVLQLHRRVSPWPESRVGQLLLIVFVASPFVTVMVNPDPIPILYADDIPGMRPYDSFATVATQVLYLLPMFLARRDLATTAALRSLLQVLVLTGLLYSVPMLFEVRFSPQLNRWIYGYFQHDFSQTIRFGSFRPVVFTPHGLWMAFYALLCLLAAAVFLREGPAEARPRQLLAFLWLGMMLYLCKSFGPAAYALAGLGLLLLFPVRLQILAAGVIACIVILYPLLRGLHLVPVLDILDFARSLSAERAWSLEYRLINEEQLLSRAAEHPWFGWGGYGRNLIHDPLTGQLWTVPDGYWIIVIGQNGWLGYVAEFGLLCLPLWLLAREALARGARLSREVGAVALMLAFNLADLLPNATIIPLTWLMVGALLGHAEGLRRARRAGSESLRKRGRIVAADGILPVPAACRPDDEDCQERG